MPALQVRRKEMAPIDQAKNLRVTIPLDLHTRVLEEKEQAGKSMTRYIERVLTEYRIL